MAYIGRTESKSSIAVIRGDAEYEVNPGTLVYAGRLDDDAPLDVLGYWDNLEPELQERYSAIWQKMKELEEELSSLFATINGRCDEL
jgi:hypothetical protein